MKKKNTGRFICMGGVSTAIAVLFQSAPVFLPGVGFAISPLSTLPIAIAAVSNVSLGLTVFISSALILVMVDVQETIILLFTTGLLGVVIGTLLYRNGTIISILFSGIALSIGMMFLTYIAAIPSFVDITNTLPVYLTFIIYFSFSLVYSSLWNIFIKKIVQCVRK